MKSSAEVTPLMGHNTALAHAALARGDTRGAEAAFEAEYEFRLEEERRAREARARAARNVGNLAMLRDPAKADVFYRKALEVEGVNPDSVQP